MKALLAVMCVVLFCGCSGVVMKEPLPETPLSNKEQEALSGAWAVDKSVVYLEFTDSGEPKLASVEWEDDAFRLAEHKVVFSKAGDALYVSMESGGKDEAATYLITELKVEDDLCLAWLPDTEVFVKLIEDGALSGKVVREKHSRQVMVDASGEAVLALLSTNSAAINYKSPMIFKKID